MVSMLYSGCSCLGSSIGRGNFFVFLSKTLYPDFYIKILKSRSSEMQFS